MVKKALALEAFKVGSKVWVLTIGVLEVNPEGDAIRAQRGHARSALFSRVTIILGTTTSCINNQGFFNCLFS